MRSVGRSGPPLAAKIFLVRFQIANHELLDRLTGLESSRQPAWLFSTPRPGFEWLVGISVFWKYRRIFPPLPRRLFELPVCRLRLRHFAFPAKLRQSLFEFAFFRGQPDGQDPANFLMQLPHLVNCQSIKIQFLDMRFLLAIRRPICKRHFGALGFKCP